MSVENGRTYVLVNGKSGTALDLSGSDNFSILGWERHDGDNQKWVLENVDNQWTFRNVGSGRYLGIGGEISDNVALAAVDEPLLWDIWPDKEDPSVHRIFAPGTRMNIDLSDHGNANNGTLVTLWGTWEGRNQTWRFEEA